MTHDSNIVPQGQTYILAGYTVNCSGTVVAWEFCYRVQNATSVTFFPGIWKINGTDGSGNTDYELIQSNNVTYNSSIQSNSSNHIDSCQRVNLLTTDPFTAPAGSVVGLYSGIGPLLLHTNTNSSITTYGLTRNLSSVSVTSSTTDVNYNIAIRVHFGEMHKKH